MVTMRWRNGFTLGVVAVAALFLTVGLIRACGWSEPLVLPDYRDSLAALREAHAAEVGRWQAERGRLVVTADSALKNSANAKAEARRLRTARVPKLGTSVPDTGMVPRPAYDAVVAEADSLWSVVRADSLALHAQSDIIRADSAAYASLRSLLEGERSQFGNERAELHALVKKAGRRGCLLGFLPTPKPSVGYGLTVTEGRVVHGPTLSIAIPMRGC